MGPPLRFVAANIAPAVVFPSDGVIQLAFDRYLLPSTILRQSIVLREASGRALNPGLKYDPATRTVSLYPETNGGWLVQEQSYVVSFVIPKDENDPNGLRAIDRAPLDPTSVKDLGFKAGPPTGAGASSPPMRFCNEVHPLLVDRCGSSTCHGSVDPAASAKPAAGLILDSWYGLEHTAIGRVANGANTSGSARANSAGAIFGVDMPIIDPGNPANSWLVYKLLMATPSTKKNDIVRACPPTSAGGQTPILDPPPVGVDPGPTSEEERNRLRDAVLGREMPYPPTYTPLTLEEIRRITTWISQGAKLNDCSKCDQ
jgi:hypothetical protein